MMRPRHVDLRPFAVNDGNRVWVLPGGLTRVALRRGRADRELLARRWLEGHLGARRPRSARRTHRAGTDRAAHHAAGRRPRARLLLLAAGPATAATADGGRSMLSRIAESLFWIGRYVERAEDTARILDVQTQLILEDPGVDEATTCRSLLSIMGVEVDGGRAVFDTADVMRMLAYDTALDRLDRCHARRGPGECPPRTRDAVDVDVGGAEHDVPRRPVGPLPLDAAAGRLPLGARPRGADQRHRRGDDDPRRGLPVPGPRAARSSAPT